MLSDTILTLLTDRATTRDVVASINTTGQVYSLAGLEHEPHSPLQHVRPGGAGALQPQHRPGGELQLGWREALQPRHRPLLPYH